MKTNQTRGFVGLVVMFAAIASIVRAVGAPDPTAPDRTLFVVVENVDDTNFELERYSRVNGHEIVMTTLKAHATELAKAAHWDGPVTVLDYGTAAPAGAQILLLTWDRGMASLVQGTNKAYLGVVIYRPLAFHPDHERIIRQIAPSTRPEEHYDSLLRAHTEMRLFVALQLAAEHEKKS